MSYFFIRYIEVMGCTTILTYRTCYKNPFCFAQSPILCTIQGMDQGLGSCFLWISRLFPGSATVWDPVSCVCVICIAFTYLTRMVFDNIYEFKMITMLVRIDTKNWLGNYNSNVVRFNSEDHLNNYLNVIYSKGTSKVIGIHYLQD